MVKVAWAERYSPKKRLKSHSDLFVSLESAPVRPCESSSAEGQWPESD